jgi:hypothetical protein
MNYFSRLWVSLSLIVAANNAGCKSLPEQPSVSAATSVATGTNTFIGWSTNGAAIFQNYLVAREWKNPIPTNNPAVTTNPFIMKMSAANSVFTNPVFVGFIPESLNHLVWTNFIAHTNGRGLQIWSQRAHPADWPKQAPIITWNTNSILWGMKGFTALSPCWEGEINPGQVPITLLTPRHGYTRGHSMGPEGFSTNRRGSNVWFLPADNALVRRTILREVVRAGKQGDYTIFLFDRDLPDTIQPLRVAALAEVQSRYLASMHGSGGSYPMFKTEQGGQVSAEVPGFSVNTWKGGDSGSPNLLPLPGELVFCGGRSTSGASPEMQADIDALTRMEGLNPKAYQLRWVDLSKYPSY